MHCLAKQILTEIDTNSKMKKNKTIEKNFKKPCSKFYTLTAPQVNKIFRNVIEI